MNIVDFVSRKNIDNNERWFIRKMRPFLIRLTKNTKFTMSTSLLYHAFGLPTGYQYESRRDENANDLLRQYFPKAMELLDVTTKEVVEAVHKLNKRPRKCLGFKIPYEVFEENTGIKMKSVFEIALMT